MQKNNFEHTVLVNLICIVYILCQERKNLNKFNSNMIRICCQSFISMQDFFLQTNDIKPTTYSSGNIWSVPLFGKISRCDMAKIALHWFVSTGRTQLICAKKRQRPSFFRCAPMCNGLKLFLKKQTRKGFRTISAIHRVSVQGHQL